MTVPKCIIDMIGKRTQTQIVQKLKNNEARPKFTALIKKKLRVYEICVPI